MSTLCYIAGTGKIRWLWRCLLAVASDAVVSTYNLVEKCTCAGLPSRPLGIPLGIHALDLIHMVANVSYAYPFLVIRFVLCDVLG